MKAYSLVNVSSQSGNKVDGNWLQDVTGDISTATQKARATERANSNRITVAVVSRINSAAPDYEYKTGLTRLD